MPFLRLTRDRRGFENTFLLHADHPGEKARLLYWYRTAPGIMLGRPPLDEDAIRAIEEQHPDIDFDWPAILALSEAMTPEDEEPPRPQKRKPGPARREPRESRRESRPGPAAVESGPVPDEEPIDTEPVQESGDPAAVTQPRAAGLLEELVGREIAARLRTRHAEIVARIHEQQVDSAVRDKWLTRSAAINPDQWDTPEAILEGVRSADGIFEQLRAELVQSPRE